MNIGQLRDILKEMDPYAAVVIKGSYGTLYPKVELTYTLRDYAKAELIISGFYPEDKVDN